MANPLPAFKHVDCEYCDEPIEEGDSVYFTEEGKLCEDCARAKDCVCQCDKYKKPQYRSCYDCHKLSAR